MYASLGYLKTFTQYLRKDIRTAMDSKLTLCRLVFQGAELLSLFFLLEVAIFSVFGQNFGLNLGVQRVGIILIYGGVLAGLLRIVNEYFRPQTVLYYLFFFLGIVAIYFFIIYLIKLFLVLQQVSCDLFYRPAYMLSVYSVFSSAWSLVFLIIPADFFGCFFFSRYKGCPFKITGD